ncbi:MAG: hypothetical protein KBT03_07215, partial [Bacteroidales bacterium]|nr:hypothetical protein [Candidatus Scybalousia scybalohippi]
MTNNNQSDYNQQNYNQPIRMIPKLNNEYVLFKAVEFGEVFGDMYLESDLDLPKNVQVDMLERCINDMIGVICNQITKLLIGLLIIRNDVAVKVSSKQ